MSKIHQSVLASRPAAMVLALSLLAGLTAPLVMLPRAHATSPSARMLAAGVGMPAAGSSTSGPASGSSSGAPPLPCTEANNNGCTELSPTPPEDTVAVARNIVLMLDDSGSMGWDYMPDWDYLGVDSSGHKISGWNSLNKGVRAFAVNALYYNPTITYTPPPKADGNLYPNSPDIADAYTDPFTSTDSTDTTDVSNYHGDDADKDHKFPYYWGLQTKPITVYPPPEPSCANGFHQDPDNPDRCISKYTNPVQEVFWRWTCPQGGNLDKSFSPPECKVSHGEGRPPTYYAAVEQYQCPAGTTGPNDDGLCSPAPPTYPPLRCLHGGGKSYNRCITTSYHNYFVYFTGTPGRYRIHFVGTADAPCSIIYSGSDKAKCVDPDDTGGTAAPNGVAAAQNVANWFSYYHTRLLMAKTAMMKAFSKLNPNYRFGFASINGNGKDAINGSVVVDGGAYVSHTKKVPYVGFDDSSALGGSSDNRLAVVRPFGAGSDPYSQRAKFWYWLAHESAKRGTPLRKALRAVGHYYKAYNQPWETMPGEPGYTQGGTSSPYACRASYTILTTDGFWNGDPPTSPSDLDGAASTDGPDNAPVLPNAITHYTQKAPFSGGETSNEGASLADVATYYWDHDLQQSIPNEVPASTADPATWQHMTTFTVGMGFSPEHILPAGTTVPQIFAWAQGGPVIASFGWPTPSGSANGGQGSINNIADLAHAALNGHGAFFSAKNPEELAHDLSQALTQINSRTVPPTPAAVNASVLASGALSLSTGYSTNTWSGALEAHLLNQNGTVNASEAWTQGGAGQQLDADYHSASGYANRNVYTDAYTLATNNEGKVTGATFDDGFQFSADNSSSLDAEEVQGLETPALAGGQDTLKHRIDYLLGDTTYEQGLAASGNDLYRKRDSLLGAILHAQPVYVSYPSSGYQANWPTDSPEAEATETYDDFVEDNANRAGTVYMAANDGMLHAFDSALKCSKTDPNDPTKCIQYGPDQEAAAGSERWAFVPRAVYANLGNLTQQMDFHFRPTVDATPVTRDVYFSTQDGNNGYTGSWHTILAGGVGLGGRGVYALDITDPTSFSAADVLWEFDSDMTMSAGCVASYGDCKSSDLGYTVSQPNIGRLADGKWVVLVPNGYFPDCSTPDIPTGTLEDCKAIAAQAPKHDGQPYSALFVLDAQTGKVIAELKTPTSIAGVTSFGLATPVLGDYTDNQIDQVAFAGDVEGNLWRFDLSSSDPSDWTVTLAYKGVSMDGHQGVQPITTTPRLFPDPATNRFMVVFGTGKYLGVGDNVVAKNGNGAPVAQAVYGIRDQGGSATSNDAYTQSDLVERYLDETVVPPTLADGSPNPSPNAGATLRCVTAAKDDACETSGAVSSVGSVPTSDGGWYISLETTTSDGTVNNAGERVVGNPGALFASNTVVIQTLITGGADSNPCSPFTNGAVMFLDATTGGPGTGVSSLGGGNIVGARVNNARTSGSLPMVSALGGAKLYLLGKTLLNSTNKNPITGDELLWRRRSWNQIIQGL